MYAVHKVQEYQALCYCCLVARTAMTWTALTGAAATFVNACRFMLIANDAQSRGMLPGLEGALQSILARP